MKKKIIGAISTAAVVAVLLLGGLLFCQHKANTYKEELIRSSEQQNLLSQRVEEVLAERDGLKADKEALSRENESLTEKIKELTTVEEIVLDAAMIEEQARQIGELATVSYCYTNVGTIDADLKFFHTDIKLPGGSKSAVVTMEGVIKAGIEVKDMTLAVDEREKIITVRIPKAKILSNELDENSMEVYDETNGLFNKINLDDSSKIRTAIKTRAEQKALEMELLAQAEQNAQMVIRNFLETEPDIKKYYQIVFE